MLSHYDAVLWYTGDDIVTRTAGLGPAATPTASRMDEILEFRAYMNEGGRVLYTGTFAGSSSRLERRGQQFYDPKGEGAVPDRRRPNPAFDPRRCLGLFGSPSSDGIDDVLEYWLGAYAMAPGDGHDEEGNLFDINGIDDPFLGLSWAFGGPASADNQDMTRSFVSTSGILPAGRVPAVRQLAIGPLGQAGRTVRAAHRRPVRLLADRRRHLQATDARVAVPGGRRQPDVLDVI